MMFQELRVIPLLKKDLSETDERVAAVQSVLDEKKTQLTHARYILRDNKITIKVRKKSELYKSTVTMMVTKPCERETERERIEES